MSLKGAPVLGSWKYQEQRIGEQKAELDPSDADGGCPDRISAAGPGLKDFCCPVTSLTRQVRRVPRCSSGGDVAAERGTTRFDIGANLRSSWHTAKEEAFAVKAAPGFSTLGRVDTRCRIRAVLPLSCLPGETPARGCSALRRNLA